MARSSAIAPRLSEPNPTTSIPSSPWTVSRIAWRFVPVPEASTASRRLTPTPAASRRPVGDDQLRKASAGRAQPPLLDQLVDPRQDLVRAQLPEPSVAGQRVVAVPRDDLAAATAEDLDR